MKSWLEVTIHQGFSTSKLSVSRNQAFVSANQQLQALFTAVAMATHPSPPLISRCHVTTLHLSGVCLGKFLSGSDFVTLH